MTCEINSKDIIRIMLQFMKENNLQESMKVLSNESGVLLNTVDSLDGFHSDILHGRWEYVLNAVNNISLPKEKMAALYEQIVFELLESNERELARELLRTTEPFSVYKSEEPQRYAKLEHLCQKPYFSAADAYESTSKEKRRYELAESLSSEVSVVPPSRLLSLLNQAMRYQQKEGLIPKGGSYDLFHGGRRSTVKDAEDKISKRLAGQIKFTVESHPETAIFSPDGQSLVTGSVDGFIEIWDYESCKLRKDLEYQANDELMMHDEAVLCCCFSRDGDHLVTGSQAGLLKLWKVSTGECMKRMNAHQQGITSVIFSKDSSQLLTTSYDNLIRLHGLKSGKTLKEFRGHSSFVNSAIFIKDGNNIVSVSTDGTFKVWDTKTTDVMISVKPQNAVKGETLIDSSLICVMAIPNTPDHVVVCTRGQTAYLMTSQGQILQTYNSGRTSAGGDFLSATISPHGKWLYCASEDGYMYVFDIREGKMEEIIKIDDREIIGLFHHPQRNIIGSMNDQGLLKLWKA